MVNYILVLSIVIVILLTIIGVALYMYFKLSGHLNFCEQHASAWCPLFTCQQNGVGATRKCTEEDGPECMNGTMQSRDPG